MTIKKRIRIKDKKIKDMLTNDGREQAKKDFFELLKRAATTIKSNN
jgi:hypothetical protein